MKLFDVAILGASISGASLGACLGMEAVEVVMIDKNSFPRRKACGEGLSNIGIDALERMGLQAKKTLSGSLKETEDATAEITALRSTIKAERELLERERKANSNQLTLIASERAKLAVALKEYDGRSKGRK